MCIRDSLDSQKEGETSIKNEGDKGEVEQREEVGRNQLNQS